MKKNLIVALSLILVVVMAVTGTMAYLTDKTEEVKNTFTVGSVFDPNEEPKDPDDPNNPVTAAFELKEHKATDDDKDGVYTLGKDEVTENAYTVLPGVAIAKDPFVRINKTLQLDAYVFVEVVDKTSEQLTVTVADTWTKISGVEGPNGGDVYYLAAGAVEAGNKLKATSILAENKIAVANAEVKAPGTVSFYGYLVQKGSFETASAAWTASASEFASAN